MSLLVDRATNKDGKTNDLIAAGEQLRKLQDRPLDSGKGNTFVPIQVNFGNGEGGGVQVEIGQNSHNISKAGDLPPPNARRQLHQNVEEARGTVNGVPIGSALDFYSHNEDPQEAFGAQKTITIEDLKKKDSRF